MSKKRRRGHGEGAIYQRESDGKWVAVLDLGYAGGKRKRKTVYGKTRREVQEKLQRLQQQHFAGVKMTDKTTTGEWLDLWMSDVVAYKSQSTQTTYDVAIRRHIKPHIGKVRLSELTPAHVQKLVSDVSRASTTDNARFAVTVLKTALTSAVKCGYISRNPSLLVDTPPKERYRATILTPQQARIFLATAKEHSHLYHLYRVALGLGMRRGELLRLQWSDVDLEGGVLHIRQSKTEAGVRSINLPDVLVQVLREQRQQVRLIQLASVEWSGDLVFPSVDGKPIHELALRRNFKRMLRVAGLPDIRFHDLRHSCASFLLAQGVQPKVVSEILGHSNIGITLNTYTHVLADVQKEAVERGLELIG